MAKNIIIFLTVWIAWVNSFFLCLPILTILAATGKVVTRWCWELEHYVLKTCCSSVYRFKHFTETFSFSRLCSFTIKAWRVPRSKSSFFNPRRKSNWWFDWSCGHLCLVTHFTHALLTLGAHAQRGLQYLFLKCVCHSVLLGVKMYMKRIFIAY